MDLISKATRNEFREVLVGYTLREIGGVFDNVGLSAKTDFVPSVSGQRRSYVEQYYAGINFSSLKDIKKLAEAYEEIIFNLEQGAATWPQNKDIIASLLRRMERDGHKYKDGHFVLAVPKKDVVQTASLVELAEESIIEHIQKARDKIAGNDFAGAITNCYTLVECLLKELLRQTGTDFKQDEGDIRELYRLLIKPMNLSPQGETLESYLKQILEGLKSQISGLFALANKGSDRHLRKFDPLAHHAKLAVNATFSLCEFLLDSYHFQKQRAGRKKTA